jgi:hypothetical protein
MKLKRRPPGRARWPVPYRDSWWFVLERFVAGLFRGRWL